MIANGTVVRNLNWKPSDPLLERHFVVLEQKGEMYEIGHVLSEGGVIDRRLISASDIKPAETIDLEDFGRWLQEDVEAYNNDPDRIFMEGFIGAPSTGQSNPIERYLQQRGILGESLVLGAWAVRKNDPTGIPVLLPEQVRRFDALYQERFHDWVIRPQQALALWGEINASSFEK